MTFVMAIRNLSETIKHSYKEILSALFLLTRM